MKTILCSEEQKNLIYHRLLSETDSPVIAGIRLYSPANLLRAEEPADAGADALRLSHMLTEQAEQFPIYRAMFRFPAFIQEILTFAKECALYRISPDRLPGDTASEQELAEILKTALSLPLKEKTVAEQYSSLLAGAAALSPIVSEIRFEADPFKARFLKDLRSTAPEFTDAPSGRPMIRAELRYAPGVRQEIEACAQDILRRNMPCSVVLCSYETQLPVLRQVFMRYGIPFSPIRESHRPAAADAYISLARFALFHDRNSFLSCLEADAFSKHAGSRLIRHLRAAMTDSEFIPLAGRIDEALFSDARKDAAAWDEEAQRFLASVAPETELLRSADQPAAALTAAFEVLRLSGLTDDPAELGAALAIRTKLNQTIPHITSREDAVFVLREIDASVFSSSEPRPCFCVVTDLSHPVDPVSTMYVLGCSGKQFPGMPLRKGLFDEAYTAKTAGYPTLEERHALWSGQLSWLENNSDLVIYSYAVSDYQGREIQPAYDVTSRIKQASPWLIEKIKPEEPSEHILSEKTAHALYETDGKIHSSVSRIERWFSCPYSWFLQSGLKIRKEMRAGLEMSDFGNLQHALMEYAVKNYGKDYCRISEDEIRSFLKPAFDSLRALLPDDTVRVSLSEERMVSSLLQTMRILEHSEQAAPSWQPAEAEQSFSEPITPHVQLRGKIDRIDYSGNSLRILDYKSSTKSLSDPKIKAGLQLQLLSYLIIASRINGRHPAGAYYFSMKNETAKSPAGNFGKTNKTNVLIEGCDAEERLQQAMIEERRIVGWSFEDPLIDDEYYKQYFKPKSGRYSYELAEQCIIELMEYFYEHAAAGEIGVDPTDGACKFCDYKAICRHHLPPRKSRELVMKGIKFKKEKEDA